MSSCASGAGDGWPATGRGRSPGSEHPRRHRPVRAIILLFTVLIFLTSAPRARPGRSCGVDALYRICLHYHLAISYEEVEAACQPGEEGNSMLELFEAAKRLGLSAGGMRLSYEELLELHRPGSGGSCATRTPNYCYGASPCQCTSHSTGGAGSCEFENCVLEE